MPEVWLRYGNSHVVLDIKFEKLAAQISSNFQPVPDDQIKVALEEVRVTDDMMILALTGSKMPAKIISQMLGMARSKGVSNISVDAPAAKAASLRAALEKEDWGASSSSNTRNSNGETKVTVNRIERGASIFDRIKKSRSALVVSEVGVDPLFGFSGIPTLLLRYFLHEKMAEAFSIQQDQGPKPAEETEALRLALASVEKLEVELTAIQIVSNSAGIGSIHVGSLDTAFGAAISSLKLLSKSEVEVSDSLIISASEDPVVHSTLTGSLNSLWNCIGAGLLKEGGQATLVSECRDGLGGRALQKYVEGKITSEQWKDLGQGGYIDGLEHLVYLEQLKEKYRLALVSALPKYYSNTKLGFTTYSSMRELVDGLAKVQSKSSKSNVITDPDIMILSPRQQQQQA